MIKKHLGDELYSKHYRQRWLVFDKKQQAKYLFHKTGHILNNHTAGKILDVGCGIGTWASYLKKIFKCDVIGIDVNNLAIKKSKRAGIKAEKVDIEGKWPFSANSFSIVTAVQVLEHVVNTDHLLEEAGRVLKPDGILLITTPNLAAWFNRLILLFGFQPFFLEASTKDKTVGLAFTRKMTLVREPVGHIRVFTLPALIDILKINGFSVERIMGGEVNYLPKFMKPLDKLFSNWPALSTDLILIARKNINDKQ